MVAALPVRSRRSFWLEGRGILLFLAFMVALICLISLGNRTYHFTHYTTTPESPLSITAAPGEKIFFTITGNDALNGLWASPGGFRISLNAPTNFSALAVTPQDGSWYGLIQTANDGETLLIDGSFTVPAPDNASISTLQGQIVGSIIYPAGDGNGNYSNVREYISIPVTIQLISPTIAFMNEQLPLYLVSGGGILLLLLLPLAYRMYDIQRPQTLAEKM